jgi:predicted peptidase
MIFLKVKYTRILFPALIIVLATITHAGIAQNNKLFKQREYIANTGDTLRYCILSPQSIDSSASYPLVLFLHGAGERGRDNQKQLAVGVGNFASDYNLKTYPCYILAPQCPEGKKWVEVDWKLPAHIQPATPSVNLIMTMDLVDSLCKTLKIDTNRLYITGLSMGGFGTWDAITRYPGKFAAAIPVCGGGDTTKAYIIKNIPVWAFHGLKDKLVMPLRSISMVRAINNAGGNAKLSTYPEVGHDAWNKAYIDPELYRWLFTKRK